MKRYSIIIILSLIISSLFFLKTDVKWQSGEYKVSWLDSSLTLSRIIDDSTSIGRIMHQVCAVGEDDTWIVAQRKPQSNSQITEYYYFSKRADTKYKNADDIVHGPFNELEFSKRKAKLNLPHFSEKF